MADIGVVHLAWVPLGIAPFERFIASYRQHDAQQAHHFTVVFNGHQTRDELTPYLQLLDATPHQQLIIDTPQQDIASYFDAARCLQHDYLCFLNSHSEILVDGWLRFLTKHALRPDVGLVGATGSWESGRYPAPERQHYRTAKGYLLAVLNCRLLNRHFGGFPNPHLRTNAFLLSRQRMLKLRGQPIRARLDALKVENGRHSLARQTQQQNLKVLVVGRDGKGYEPEDWPRSLTFRQGEQENLLIADNRTRDYATGDALMRRLLAGKAWGTAFSSITLADSVL